MLIKNPTKLGPVFANAVPGMTINYKDSGREIRGFDEPGTTS